MSKTNEYALSRRDFMKSAAVAGLGLGALASGIRLIGSPKEVAANPDSAGDATTLPQTLLEATEIDQFAHPLPKLDAVPGGTIETIIAGNTQIEINMEEFKANMLPSGTVGGYSGTWVWGYVTPSANIASSRDTYTGPVVVANRGIPTEFKFNNNLGNTATSQLIAYTATIDQSLHWANPASAPMFVPNDDSPPNWIGNPNHYSGPIAAAVHLHGAEDPAAIDGGPESWFLSDGSQVGKGFYSMGWDGMTPQNYCIYRYPNTQEAAPLWFHDHTLGATRLNVYMGLAGAYALIDPKLKLPDGLGPYSLSRKKGASAADDVLIPLVIQDRSFDTDGQLYFNAGWPDSVNPEHLYWVPEFFGNTIAVNGKVWPNLEVKAQRYRFYLINGSNSRTYVLTFEGNSAVPPMYQIGTDQGYLDTPVLLNRLVVMPGERAELIIDFGGFAPGTDIILKNLGPDDPYGGGQPGIDFDPANPDTTGKVMRFQVVAGAYNVDFSYDPADSKNEIRTANDTIVRLVDPVAGTLAANVIPNLTRLLTLNEIGRDDPISTGGVDFEGGPLEALVNNSKWNGLRPDESDPNVHTSPSLATVNGGISDGNGNFLTEWPLEGTTEVWEIVNLTADAHPIHTHLAQFQIMNREPFIGDPDLVTGYYAAYAAAFPGGDFIPGYGPPLLYTPSAATGWKYGGNPDITQWLSGLPQPPLPNEAGWKDTFFVPPGCVSRFVVRWAPQDMAVRPGDPSMKLRYAFTPNCNIEGRDDAIYHYVWHCHIVDHEDNEMMRPDAVNPVVAEAQRTFKKTIDY